MKPAALVLVASFTVVASVAVGCAHPQRRNDWRNPAPSMQGRTCTSDADCRGGACAIDIGASQGTCAAPTEGPGGAGDAGTTNPGLNPGPNVQPSSSDIQI